jgi:hypothetical protein
LFITGNTTVIVSEGVGGIDLESLVEVGDSLGQLTMI